MAVDKDSIIKRFLDLAHGTSYPYDPIEELPFGTMVGFDYGSAGPFTTEETAYLRSLGTEEEP